MANPQVPQAERFCPKTGRPIRNKPAPAPLVAPKARTRSRHFLTWLAPMGGLLALAWFLIRVIPKPSRAAYPCQQAAFPVASAFVVWLVGVVASALAWPKARAGHGVALLCLVAAVSAAWLSWQDLPQPVAIASSMRPQPNAPMGEGKGIYPGRVVWVHDPKAVNYSGHAGHWYDPANFDRQVIEGMMSKTLRTLAGEKTDALAWQAIFRHFNQVHGRGDHGYQAGEKIMIKINLSGTHQLNKPQNLRWDEAVITTPAMTQTLLKQLIETVGVPQADITVGDTDSYVAPMFFDPIKTAYPRVNCLAFKTYDGRVGATYSDHRIYWSSPEAANTAPDFAPQSYAQATYLINFGQLKAHNGGGITLCGKNDYGSLIRTPGDNTASDGTPYFNLHHSLVFSRGTPGYGHYRCMVDFMGHADFGQKTVLYMLDGLFGGWDAVYFRRDDPNNIKWHTPPFNDYWPCSLLASQDPVAIDSVGYDILWEEAPYEPYHFARLPGADDYLREAALADNPPSHTFYDPNHEKPTVRLKSLGVHEHWNNPVDRKYSRNLGKDEGIELVTDGVN